MTDELVQSSPALAWESAWPRAGQGGFPELASVSLAQEQARGRAPARDSLLLVQEQAQARESVAESPVRARGLARQSAWAGEQASFWPVSQVWIWLAQERS